MQNYGEIKTISKEEAVKQGLYNVIGDDIDTAYINELKKLVINKDIIEKVEKI